MRRSFEKLVCDLRESKQSREWKTSLVQGKLDQKHYRGCVLDVTVAFLRTIINEMKHQLKENLKGIKSNRWNKGQKEQLPEASVLT